MCYIGQWSPRPLLSPNRNSYIRDILNYPNPQSCPKPGAFFFLFVAFSFIILYKGEGYITFRPHYWDRGSADIFSSRLKSHRSDRWHCSKWLTELAELQSKRPKSGLQSLHTRHLSIFRYIMQALRIFPSAANRLHPCPTESSLQALTNTLGWWISPILLWKKL